MFNSSVFELHSLVIKAFWLCSAVSLESNEGENLFFFQLTLPPLKILHFSHSFPKTSLFISLIPFHCQWVTSFSTAM